MCQVMNNRKKFTNIPQFKKNVIKMRAEHKYDEGEVRNKAHKYVCVCICKIVTYVECQMSVHQINTTQQQEYYLCPSYMSK